MNTEESEFERIEREIKLRALPDAIHHTDPSETLEYIQGWNDCRAAMMTGQPADGLIRQYINSIVSNKPDEAANVTKAMVDYVYTTPQPAQRTWVGLTDAEVEDFVSALWPVGAGAGKLLRAIEAKLKEKNT